MFLQIYDGQEKLSEIELGGKPATIGSDNACTVVLTDESVSGKHAVLEPRGSAYHIRHQGGCQGMLLNGQPVEENSLQEGDSIQIGKYTLRVAESSSLPGQDGNVEIRANRCLQRLSHLARELGALDRPEALLDRLLNTVLIELDADRASIFLNSSDAHEESRDSTTLTPIAVRSRAPGMSKPSSALCAPLSQGSEVHGVIYIERSSGRPPFQESENRILGTIATISGIGIANVRNLARTLGEKNRLEERCRSLTWKFTGSILSMLSRLEGEIPLLRPLAPEDPFEAKAIENIELNVNGLCGITRQFIEFAELEMRTANRAGTRRPTPLGPLVRKAIGEASESARSSRILLSDRLEEWVPQVEAVPERLQLAMNCIVSNLVKLSAEGAILAIECGGKGNDFHIDFSSDDAPTFPAQEGSGSELFDRFATAKLPTEGLGFEIARQIVIEHGGILRARILEGLRKRRGALISIRLPLPCPEQSVAPCEAAASATSF